MSAPTPQAIIDALGHLGISVKAGNLDLVKGYDDISIQAHQGQWTPAYVVLHDTGTGIPTANLKPAQSLDWCIHNEFFPVRACHFLIGRDGIVHFVYAYACYHAGTGGPYGPDAGTPGDTNVGESVMNTHAYGIEHESSGLGWDLTAVQVANGSKTAAALLHAMGKGQENSLNHKDWTDVLQKDGRTRTGKYKGRKVDTRQSRAWWWAKITPQLAILNAKPPIVPPSNKAIPPFPGNFGRGSTNKPCITSVQVGLVIPHTGVFDWAMKAKVTAVQTREFPKLGAPTGVVNAATYNYLARPI